MHQNREVESRARATSEAAGARDLSPGYALLDLPFEHVIVSHGEPVTRADYERALERAPWSGQL